MLAELSGMRDFASCQFVMEWLGGGRRNWDQSVCIVHSAFSRETVVKLRFRLCWMNPFVRSCVSIARNCSKIAISIARNCSKIAISLCWMNPFVRSCVSIARNCSKIAILPVLDEPFRKIVRVNRPKL